MKYKFNKQIQKPLILILLALFTLSISAEFKTFSDLTPQHTFYDYVMSLSDNGIINGYSDGTFRADESLSRGAMAKFTKNGIGVQSSTSCDPFSDVPLTHTFYTEIMSLKCNGIISGYSDGTYKPDTKVTRGQAMKFVINGARIKQEDSSFLNNPSGTFSDVGLSHTFYNYILSAYAKQIVSGYSSGLFGPEDLITRGAMSKIVQKVRVELSLDEPISNNTNNQVLKTLYVSSTGDDSNTGESENIPLKTIQSAIMKAEAGTEIRVASGEYEEKLELRDLHGTSENPIRIIGDSANPSNYPIITGGDPSFSESVDNPGLMIKDSSWIILERLHIIDHSETTIYVENSTNFVIRRNIIKYNKNGIKAKKESNHILIEYNDISQNLPESYSWSTLKGSKYEGAAYISFGGAGFIEIRNNYIHNMMNGVVLYNGSRRGEYYDSNVFVHHNKFEDIVDDSYEPESYAFNNHFFNNILINVHRMVSLAPGGDQKTGPIYVYGNYMVLSEDPTNESISQGRINSAIKLDVPTVNFPNTVYYFNNTADLDISDVNGYGIDVLDSKVKYLQSYNNIFATKSDVYTSDSLSLTSSILGNNMSNNAFGYAEDGSWENTDPLLTNRNNQDGRLLSNSPALSKSINISLENGFVSSNIFSEGRSLGAYNQDGSMHSFPQFKYEVPPNGETLNFSDTMEWPVDIYGGTNPNTNPAWMN